MARNSLKTWVSRRVGGGLNGFSWLGSRVIKDHSQPILHTTLKVNTCISQLPFSFCVFSQFLPRSAAGVAGSGFLRPVPTSDSANFAIRCPLGEQSQTPHAEREVDNLDRNSFNSSSVGSLYLCRRSRRATSRDRHQTTRRRSQTPGSQAVRGSVGRSYAPF